MEWEQEYTQIQWRGRSLEEYSNYTFHIARRNERASKSNYSTGILIHLARLNFPFALTYLPFHNKCSWLFPSVNYKHHSLSTDSMCRFLHPACHGDSNWLTCTDCLSYRCRRTPQCCQNAATGALDPETHNFPYNRWWHSRLHFFEIHDIQPGGRLT